MLQLPDASPSMAPPLGMRPVMTHVHKRFSQQQIPGRLGVELRITDPAYHERRLAGGLYGRLRSTPSTSTTSASCVRSC
jgi:hypothetical protein